MSKTYVVAFWACTAHSLSLSLSLSVVDSSTVLAVARWNPTHRSLTILLIINMSSLVKRLFFLSWQAVINRTRANPPPANLAHCKCLLLLFCKGVVNMWQKLTFSFFPVLSRRAELSYLDQWSVHIRTYRSGLLKPVFLSLFHAHENEHTTSTFVFLLRKSRSDLGVH